MNQTLSGTTEITRENLMDAFWQLYCHKKIEKISVKEICALAGYNRSTFYVYFKDVYEILETIEEDTISTYDFKTAVLEQIQNSQGNQKQITIELILALFEKNKSTLPILLSENGDPYFRQKLLNKLTPTVLSSFKTLTPAEKIEVGYLMEYQSAAILSTIAKWYNNGKDIPLEKFLTILVASTINGVQKELSKYLADL